MGITGLLCEMCVSVSNQDRVRLVVQAHAQHSLIESLISGRSYHHPFIWSSQLLKLVFNRAAYVNRATVVTALELIQDKMTVTSVTLLLKSCC